MRKRFLRRDTPGDLMYRLAALQAELGNGTTAPRRKELQKQIGELVWKMLARTEGGPVPVSRPKKKAAKARRRP
jgi:hypothetical protein